MLESLLENTAIISNKFAKIPEKSLLEETFFKF